MRNARAGVIPGFAAEKKAGNTAVTKLLLASASAISTREDVAVREMPCASAMSKTKSLPAIWALMRDASKLRGNRSVSLFPETGG